MGGDRAGTDRADTISGLWTFDRGAATAPFAVAQATAPTVTNLDADKLDTYEASAFPRKAENATISGLWTFDRGAATAPFAIAQATAPTVTNLDADKLDTYHAVDFFSGCLGSFLMLPALRGLWTMGANDDTGAAIDFSVNSHGLAYQGNPMYNYTGAQPYIDFDGVGDYLYTVKMDTIVGTEAYMAAAVRGLTLGGWFWRDVHQTVGDLDGMMGKTVYAGNQCAYLLGGSSVPSFNFYISSDGTTGAFKYASSAAVSFGAWYFVVGRFVPSTSIDIYVNNVKVSNTTTIPASIYANTANFEVGSYNAGANRMNGRASLCFVCAAALSDAIIAGLYNRSKALFGL
jgi:hypothetical protein